MKKPNLKIVHTVLPSGAVRVDVYTATELDNMTALDRWWLSVQQLINRL